MGCDSNSGQVLCFNDLALELAEVLNEPSQKSQLDDGWPFTETDELIATVDLQHVPRVGDGSRVAQ